MFGILRKLFSKGGPASAPTPAPPSVAVSVKSDIKKPPAVTKSAAKESELPEAAGSQDSSLYPGFMVIPLKEILGVLPEPMRVQRIQSSQNDIVVSLPIAEIMPQLSKGFVRVPFRLIKQGSPAGTFIGSSGLDSIAVTLPLSLILKHINPNLLSRRSDQKVISVPEEVGPVFNSQAQPIASQQPVIQDATPEAPVVPNNLPSEMAPKGMEFTPPFLQRQQHSNTSLSARTITSPFIAPKPESQNTQMPATPVPMPATPVPMPATPVPMPATPVPMPMADTVLPKQSTSTEDGKPLEIPLKEIENSLPEEIRKLIGGHIDMAILSIPWAEVEKGMKRGRMVFSWERLRDWIQPAPSHPGSPQDSKTEVTLPLPRIVPLFIARGTKLRAQKKVSIEESIPDVFAGKSASGSSSDTAATPSPSKSAFNSAGQKAILAPRSPSSGPATNISASTATAHPPSSVQGSQTAVQSPVDQAHSPSVEAASKIDIGQVFGVKGKTFWTPMELVQKTRQLPGVAGALIALPDGLLVTSDTPPGIDGEVTAAFLPQMFGRMSHYVKELKLGDLSTLRIGIAEYSILIYRLPNLYFLVASQPGMVLPEAQLSIVASHLAQQSKS